MGDEDIEYTDRQRALMVIGHMSRLTVSAFRYNDSLEIAEYDTESAAWVIDSKGQVCYVYRGKIPKRILEMVATIIKSLPNPMHVEAFLAEFRKAWEDSGMDWIEES